jgi:periplasmic divalent cation tolerance protein
VTGLVTVEINCPDKAVATALAEVLVARRLAAAANIHPEIFSLYRWQGEIVRRMEVPLVLKTRAALASALADAVRSLHPYDTPSILTRPIEATDGYAAWVAAETAEPA